MATEDIITDAGQTPTAINAMVNSYCRLNPISCGPVLTDVKTDFYREAEANEWANTRTLPWMAV